MQKKAILVLSFGLVLFLIIYAQVDVPVAFLTSWFVTLLMCMGLGYSFQELYEGSLEYCRQAASPILFLMCAGTMTGIWNQCGTIPAMTRLGLTLIRPDFYLPLAFILCFLFSLTIGTSFGTVGTLGVVFISIGASLGLPTETCAHVIIWGSFTGFIFSPLSDCMNISTEMVKMDRTRSCLAEFRYLGPTAGLLFCYVLWISFRLTGNGVLSSMSEAPASSVVSALGNAPATIEETKQVLGSCMKVGLPAYLPVILVFVLMFKKLPSIMALIIGTLSGVLVSLFYQGQSLYTAIQCMWTGSVPGTGNSWFDSMFTRGGVYSMLNTLLLFIGCFSLFGLLNCCGIMDEVLRPLTKHMNTQGKAIWITLLISSVATFCAASGICAIVFTINILLPVFEERGYDKFILITSSVTGGMYLSCLVPWHSNAVTPGAFLGVDPIILARGNVPILVVLLVILVLQMAGGPHKTN